MNAFWTHGSRGIHEVALEGCMMLHVQGLNSAVDAPSLLGVWTGMN